MSIVVADGTNLAHRAWYAAAGTPDRIPGLVQSMLDAAVRTAHADQLLVCFDGPDGSKARRALLPSYKAHRGTKDAGLVTALDELPMTLTQAGLVCTSRPDREADDLLADAALRYDDVVLFTSDKDVFSLLAHPGVRVLRPGSPPEWFSPDDVTRRFGVQPSSYALYCALCGDSSDGIAGIAGVGPKTASALLAKLETLEELLSDIESGGETVRSTLGGRARRLLDDPEATCAALRVNYQVVTPRLGSNLPTPGTVPR